MRLEALVGDGAAIVGPEATLLEVARAMATQKTGAVAVVDRTGMIGICTDRDLAMAIGDGYSPDDPVTSCMTESPDVVEPDVGVSDAAAWMLETGYRHLPVMSGGELLGIVDMRDVLWALFPKG
ncbi:MAG: CBS domain-containing protein [Actinomycetota bacterium]|nr:CBS domain-containing protein [Actinomycetota bacterium]